MNNSPWPQNSDILRLSHRSDRCTVLGPGIRAILWVQGCPLRCEGCIAPEAQPFSGGTEIQVSVLSEELLRLPDIEGITFSGGEPMSQATALCNLVDQIRCKRDLSFLCYSGYTLEYLRENGTPAQQTLLERLDILIDGPYIRSRHTNQRWRGSDNQQVYFLTERYRYLTSTIHDSGDWIEFEFDKDGNLHWMGIPPENFRSTFENTMAKLGITWDSTKGEKK